MKTARLSCFWYYYGQYYDFHARMLPPKPPVATGSITKKGPAAPADDELKRRLAEAECSALKAKEVATLIERRQATFADYTKCLSEWRPLSNKTPEQRCSSKLDVHVQAGQDVKDRQAKDCTTTTAK